MSEKLFDTGIKRTAWISSCQRYRHSLGRHWDRSKGFVLFIMLNPSTADADKDDPTIRRCIGFAKCWGYGGIEVCNLFDWRATKPEHLRNKLAIAVSDKCDMMIRRRARQAGKVIAAWGNVPWAERRIKEVFEMVYQWHEKVLFEEKRWDCLRLTKGGYPSHPLYVPANVKPTLFW